MKLSDAIRLGAMLDPQAFAIYRSYTGETCALGAACRAVGIEDAVEMSDYLSRQMDGGDWHLEKEVQHPMLRAPMPLFATITDLNDEYHWSREQIADWIESVER